MLGEVIKTYDPEAEVARDGSEYTSFLQKLDNLTSEASQAMFTLWRNKM
jgi:hypothetical protein